MYKTKEFPSICYTMRVESVTKGNGRSFVEDNILVIVFFY